MVSAIRSQAVYHAVAECSDAGDAPTLCVLLPDRPYVSIGYHQDAERVVDLGFCREQGLAVIRRRTGGGAVLLDRNQLFFHLVVPTERLTELRLPLRFGERYPRLIAPALAAYRKLGVAAEFRPVSDIEVGGRKIGGTGAADIGEAFVFVGSMMLAFDHALMARLLRLAGARLREAVRDSIVAQVTSLEQVTGKRPDMETVRVALLAGFGEQLGLELETGRLSGREEAKTKELERLFASHRWLRRIAWDRALPRKLTISAAVSYVDLQAPGGGLGMAARVVDGRIEELLLSDGVAVRAAAALRRALVGLGAAATERDERLARLARDTEVTQEMEALARRLVATVAQDDEVRRAA
jgi:lipoate-protein ligase A